MNNGSTPLPMPVQQRPPEPPALQQMLLVEKVHYTFEMWFINLFRAGQLDNDTFSMAGLRHEYMTLCWKEEYLWNRWKENVNADK